MQIKEDMKESRGISWWLIITYFRDQDEDQMIWWTFWSCRNFHMSDCTSTIRTWLRKKSCCIFLKMTTLHSMKNSHERSEKWSINSIDIQWSTRMVYIDRLAIRRRKDTKPMFIFLFENMKNIFRIALMLWVWVANWFVMNWSEIWEQICTPSYIETTHKDNFQIYYWDDRMKFIQRVITLLEQLKWSQYTVTSQSGNLLHSSGWTHPLHDKYMPLIKDLIRKEYPWFIECQEREVKMNWEMCKDRVQMCITTYNNYKKR